MARKEPKDFCDIKSGSKVTYIKKVGASYQQFVGRAAMKGPVGSDLWVVDPEGEKGANPDIVSQTNFRKTT